MFMTALDLEAKKRLRNYSLIAFMDLIRDGWHVKKLTSNSITYQKNGKCFTSLFVL